MPKATCSICGSTVETRQLVSPHKLEDGLLEIIQRDRPTWDGKRAICTKCREQYRAKKFFNYLEAEYHKISEMEANLVGKIARRARVSRLVNKEYDEKMTLGERISDRVAQFGGSWPFIILFAGLLVAWMFVNSVFLARRPFDPYPYILLNLVLSTLAALQAPVIMMSQNRQAARDRLEAQHDYEVNLMAEMEIRDLHDKLDALRFKQWHELWQMQQRQLELLEVVHRVLGAHGLPQRPSEAAPAPPTA